MTATPASRLTAALLATATGALITIATSAHAEKGDPENLVKWREGLTSSAQPNADYLARVKCDPGFDRPLFFVPVTLLIGAFG